MLPATDIQQRLRDQGMTIAVDGGFGPKSYAVLLAWVANKSAPTALMLQLGQACSDLFPQFQIDTPLRLAHNLAQACVETGGFNQLRESLNYSVSGLLSTFGTGRITSADAQRLGRKNGEPPLSADRQAAIANIVYGGVFGRTQLGNTQPGDGFLFRGRGWKQTTGRFNYGQVKALAGLDVVNEPDLLAQPENGVRAGCVFWASKNCNALADADDIVGLTQRVNGGQNGIVQRKAALLRAKQVLV